MRIHLEPYRAFEFGFTDSIGIVESRLRSNIQMVMMSYIRNDMDPAWKQDVERLCRDLKINRLGTPMQHAAFAHRRFAKSWIEAFLKGDFYPYGVAVPGTMRKPPSGGAKQYRHGPEMLWHFPKKYRTELFNVDEYNGKIRQRLMSLIGQQDPEADEEKVELSKAIVDTLDKLKNTKGPYVVTPFFFLPRTEHPEQIDAVEYHAECNKWQASKAGRKAKQLLLDNLTSDQQESYFKRGYFLVVPKHQEDELHNRRIYAIQRGYPNGNVKRVRQRYSISNKLFYYPTQTFCFHTKEPHAIDDILLGQKLLLENNEPDFLNRANGSNPESDLPLQWVGTGY